MGKAKLKYVLISPIRNEQRYLAQTINSVVSQTVLPEQWIIVDDNSTDGSYYLAKNYAKRFHFIQVIKKIDSHKNLLSSDRLAWAAEAKAFNYGLRFVQSDYDLIGKLDGDVCFGPNYFAQLIERFQENPKLGIAGGHCYYQKGNGLKLEKVPNYHVRGATKLYRRQCFLQIGGIEEVLGWDTIDEIKARLYGWHTQSFFQPQLIHLRPWGSAGGSLRGKIRFGSCLYYLDYHPLFLMLVILKHLFKHPPVVGGIAVFYGYLRSLLKGLPKYSDPLVRSFIREEQLKRLTLFLNRAKS